MIILMYDCENTDRSRHRRPCGLRSQSPHAGYRQFLSLYLQPLSLHPYGCGVGVDLGLGLRRRRKVEPPRVKPVLARRSSLQHAGVAPPHASSGGTLRSIPHYAPSELRRVPSRIHPRSEDRGSLPRRVDSRSNVFSGTADPNRKIQSFYLPK